MWSEGDGGIKLYSCAVSRRDYVGFSVAMLLAAVGLRGPASYVEWHAQKHHICAGYGRRRFPWKYNLICIPIISSM